MAEFDKLFEDPPAGLAGLMKLPPLELVLQPVSALQLLAHIQLAMRHPGLKPDAPATEKVLQIAAIIEQHLGAASPEIKALCEAGWNSEHDR